MTLGLGLWESLLSRKTAKKYPYRLLPQQHPPLPLRDVGEDITRASYVHGLSPSRAVNPVTARRSKFIHLSSPTELPMTGYTLVHSPPSTERCARHRTSWPPAASAQPGARWPWTASSSSHGTRAHASSTLCSSSAWCVPLRSAGQGIWGLPEEPPAPVPVAVHPDPVSHTRAALLRRVKR